MSPSANDGVSASHTVCTVDERWVQVENLTASPGRIDEIWAIAARGHAGGWFCDVRGTRFGCECSDWAVCAVDGSVHLVRDCDVPEYVADAFCEEVN
jgi:hypothetical protein